MGKINCNSSKLKFEDHINKKCFNDYEKSVVDEYHFIKNLSEGKEKPTLVDQFFTMTNYKKKLGRLHKWINIAYKDLTDEDKLLISERKSQYNNDDPRIFQADQLDKLNNMLDEMNSVSIDSSVDNYKNEQTNTNINKYESLRLYNLPTFSLNNISEYNKDKEKV